MSIKLTTIFDEVELEDSKFFGEILLPSSWLEEDVFSPDEMFLCQINCEQLYEAIGKTALPKTGMLYFFIDYGKKEKAVVRFADCELDAYTCFNEDWESDYDVVNDFPVEFENGEGGTCLLCKDENVQEGEVCLLRFTPNSLEDLDFLEDEDCALYFIIDEKSLKIGDFTNVKLKIA